MSYLLKVYRSEAEKGIFRTSYYRKLKELGLEPDQEKEEP